MLVTIGTRENYRSEFLKFEVANFETSYHAIFGRPALAKFMVIPNYTYLVLKMPGPNGVLSLKGDLQKSYECDNAAVALAEKQHYPAMTVEIKGEAARVRQEELEVPAKKLGVAKPTKDVKIMAIDLSIGDSSKTALIGKGLPPK